MKADMEIVIPSARTLELARASGIKPSYPIKNYEIPLNQKHVFVHKIE